MNVIQNKSNKSLTKPLKFVFIPKSVHPWNDLVKKGADQAIAEYKQMGIEITTLWDAPPVADIEQHKQKIEANVKSRPDGLAIASIAPTTNTRSINDAVKAGLNVITFDTDAPESLRKIYIGHAEDYKAGKDLAEVLAEKIGQKGKVGIFTGTLTALNHAARVNGFKEGIGRYKDIQIVFASPDSDDVQQAENLTEMALHTYPDIQGFFCCNASNTIGCARAIKKAGKVGQVHIVGMDDLPEILQSIKEGVIDAVKVQQEDEMGYWAIVYLVALNRGHTIPKEHLIGSVLLTKETL
jgi:ribose transport system substrate-binding protein